MEAIKRILRYLKAIVGDELVYFKDKLYEIGHRFSYTDADWAEDLDFYDIVFSLTIMLWYGVAKNKRSLLDQV